MCVDIDPRRIRESRPNAQRAGVAERIRFLDQDLFETELEEATVVTLFLWPSVNERLRPKRARSAQALSLDHFGIGKTPPMFAVKEQEEDHA